MRNQTLTVLKHLRTGSITKLQCLNNYGILNLGDCIFKLRKRGYDITTTMVKTSNSSFAKYQLRY